MALLGLFGKKETCDLDDIFFGRGASPIFEVSVDTMVSALTNENADVRSLFFETVTAGNSISSSALLRPLPYMKYRGRIGGNDSVFCVIRVSTIVATPEHGIGVLVAPADKVGLSFVFAPFR